MGTVGSVNSWFTDTHRNGVQISVEIGDLKLKVYQASLDNEGNIVENSKVEILTNEINHEYGTDEIEEGQPNTETNPQYIDLGGEIVPETPVDLVLVLANQDSGSASMFVRFKFEIYVRGLTSDTKIEGVTITGFKTPDATTCGFVKEDDGYYYYQDNEGNNALFAKNAEVTMMHNFTVPLSAFLDANGNMLLTHSETIYIKLLIDGSTNSSFVV
ncbi:MAG: hypothetical protein J6Q13_00730 [Clostridia bacterium]|nr:hypothetical protein [Clostridia bacterium]